MSNISETFIVETNEANEYLLLLPNGEVQVLPNKEAVLAVIKKRGKRKAGKDGVHTATIEWRE